MKIGIPQTLTYYTYGKIFQKFLKNLGLEVILSPKTNKKILEKGLKLGPNEVCLPIKLYFGHINEIKDSVDYLLLPRIIQEGKKLYPCPRIKNVTDIVINSMENLPKILDPLIEDKEKLDEVLRKLGKQLKQDDKKIETAIKEALKKEKRKVATKKNKKTLAVLSHPYHLQDEFLNGMLFKILKKYGINTITNEEITQKIKHKEENNILWTSEKEILNAYSAVVQNKLAKGIIHLLAFNCGVAASSQIQFKEKIPLLTLTIDEHTSQTALQTRVEAFLDILK